MNYLANGESSPTTTLCSEPFSYCLMDAGIPTSLFSLSCPFQGSVLHPAPTTSPLLHVVEAQGLTEHAQSTFASLLPSLSLTPYMPPLTPSVSNCTTCCLPRSPLLLLSHHPLTPSHLPHPPACRPNSESAATVRTPCRLLSTLPRWSRCSCSLS